MKITVEIVGLGYMGLPMAVLLATRGVKVIGVDVDEKKVGLLKEGKLPLDEPGLLDAFREAIKSENISFTLAPKPADFFVIAVPTPYVPTTRTADLSMVRKAAHSIVPVLKKSDVVILESTVTPGTCAGLLRSVLEKSGLVADKDFDIVHCPERAFPGQTMFEIVNNDRIIGANNEKAAKRVSELYKKFVKGEILTTSLVTAETVKLMENTFRDVNIALANEFAKIAEENSINVWEAINLANRHPRVNIHLPGPGVGGHCIAIDPWFLSQVSQRANLIKTARSINDEMPLYVSKKVESLLGSSDGVVTALGVAYKPNVDDARETPAANIIRLLSDIGYEVRAHDFFVKDDSYNLHSLENSLKNSDCIILITHHDEYKKLDPKKAKQLMRRLNIVDTRNHLDRKKWEDEGYTVSVLGDGRLE